MIWDFFQQLFISQAQSNAWAARHAAADAQTQNRLLVVRVQKLEESFERLSLASMAMAEILSDRVSVSQEDFEAKIEEIDLRDGKLDGKVGIPAIACPQCHHVNAPSRRKCLYCGEPLPGSLDLPDSRAHEDD